MRNIGSRARRVLVASALASAIVVGSAVSPLSAPPAQAIDTVQQMCAGLWQKKSRVSCLINHQNNVRKFRDKEVRCLKGAGIAVTGLFIDHKLSNGKSSANTLALRMIAAGSLGCIAGVWG